MKKGTTFSDGLEVKPLDNDVGPRVRIEMDLEASAVIAATAPSTAAGFFLVRVITTAGSTVNAKVPFFNV